MPDFRMNKNEPKGSNKLVAIAGYNESRRAAATTTVPPKEKFEVTPDLGWQVPVEEVPMATMFGATVTPTLEEDINENDASSETSSETSSEDNKEAEAEVPVIDLPVKPDTQEVDSEAKSPLVDFLAKSKKDAATKKKSQTKKKVTKKNTEDITEQESIGEKTDDKESK